MGQDKALLAWRDATLLDHAIGTVRAVTSDVVILCGPERRYEDFGIPIVVDEICGAGPIAGLHAALVSASLHGVEIMVWLAVDLPGVPATVLESLLQSLGDADVAMARTERGVEPLCAAFRVEPCLAGLHQGLVSGRFRLAEGVGEARMALVDFSGLFFSNLNTAEEYDRAAEAPR